MREQNQFVQPVNFKSRALCICLVDWFWANLCRYDWPFVPTHITSPNIGVRLELKKWQYFFFICFLCYSKIFFSSDFPMSSETRPDTSAPRCWHKISLQILLLRCFRSFGFDIFLLRFWIRRIFAALFSTESTNKCVLIVILFAYCLMYIVYKYIRWK